MTVFTSVSPIVILLIPVVPSLFVLVGMAVAQSLRARRKDSPITWRAGLRPKAWLP
jgi:hypothetical protein